MVPFHQVSYNLKLSPKGMLSEYRDNSDFSYNNTVNLFCRTLWLLFKCCYTLTTVTTLAELRGLYLFVLMTAIGSAGLGQDTRAEYGCKFISKNWGEEIIKLDHSGVKNTWTNLNDTATIFQGYFWQQNIKRVYGSYDVYPVKLFQWFPNWETDTLERTLRNNRGRTSRVKSCFQHSKPLV